jgi:WD40 repeat protein
MDKLAEQTWLNKYAYIHRCDSHPTVYGSCQAAKTAQRDYGTPFHTHTNLHTYTQTHLHTQICFTSDGLRLLSGSEDSTMRLWDAFSGELIGTIQAHLLPIHSVSFIQGFGGQNIRGRIVSSDWMAVSASRDKSLKVWDLESSKETKMMTGHIGRYVCVV